MESVAGGFGGVGRKSLEAHGGQSLQSLISRINFYADGFQSGHSQQRLYAGVAKDDSSIATACMFGL